MSENRDSFESNVTKSGWLLMRSKYSKTWKKRWLVLESSHLSYSKTQEVRCLGLNKLRYCGVSRLNKLNTSKFRTPVQIKQTKPEIAMQFLCRLD